MTTPSISSKRFNEVIELVEKNQTKCLKLKQKLTFYSFDIEINRSMSQFLYELSLDLRSILNTLEHFKTANYDLMNQLEQAEKKNTQLSSQLTKCKSEKSILQCNQIDSSRLIDNFNTVNISNQLFTDRSKFGDVHHTCSCNCNEEDYLNRNTTGISRTYEYDTSDELTPLNYNGDYSRSGRKLNFDYDALCKMNYNNQVSNREQKYNYDYKFERNNINENYFPLRDFNENKGRNYFNSNINNNNISYNNNDIRVNSYNNNNNNNDIKVNSEYYNRLKNTYGNPYDYPSIAESKDGNIKKNLLDQRNENAQGLEYPLEHNRIFSNEIKNYNGLQQGSLQFKNEIPKNQETITSNLNANVKQNNMQDILSLDKNIPLNSQSLNQKNFQETSSINPQFPINSQMNNQMNEKMQLSLNQDPNQENNKESSDLISKGFPLLIKNENKQINNHKENEPNYPSQNELITNKDKNINSIIPNSNQNIQKNQNLELYSFEKENLEITKNKESQNSNQLPIQKEKIARVERIVMEAFKDDKTINYLKSKLGQDFEEKIANADVDEEYLNKTEQVLKELKEQEQIPIQKLSKRVQIAESNKRQKDIKKNDLYSKNLLKKQITDKQVRYREYPRGWSSTKDYFVNNKSSDGKIEKLPFKINNINNS